ncbi:MAG: DUF4333 domain-containing protein [Mycobacterium sp.]
MTTTRIGTGAAVLALAGVIGAGLSGCSVKVETSSAKSVSAADLQKDLTDRLTKAGNAPKSVTCAGDLPAEVGKSASCEVVLSETNIVQANVTATKVDGTTVDFTYAPALTREQLQKAVTGLAEAESVTCDAGLDGQVDAATKCQVVKDGTTTDATVTVTKVDGLSIDFSVTS